MAKRSKKKNPNLLSEKQRADLRHNQELDEKKRKLDLKLNITLGIVIAVTVISFLLLPALNMNFTGSLKEFLGDLIPDDKDQTMGITVDMSFIDILFAMTKGFDNSIDYIVSSNDSGMNAEILKNAFMTKVTQEEIDALDNAYIASFAISILFFVSLIALITLTAIKRSKKKDGILLFVSVLLFSILSALQWVFFVAVGAASAGKGQIQPHISSYLILAASIALSCVYGLYRRKVKAIKADRRPVEERDGSSDGR